ncbi:response regulator transcription factor [Iodidimonas sp. SYSU 1G8]|uniref:response regulator transcription factor n=1 Tax=Iodidimonas sp. SYSU 1G8 TaxID=3133967 RepID=UPI0031FF4735
MQHSLWIVDPSRLLREGLKSLLADSHFMVTAEAASLTALGDITACRQKPDIIIVSLQSSLSAPSAEEGALTALCARWSDVPVVTLTPELSVPQLVAALKAGASGYLVKDVGPAALRESLALVLMGEKVLPSELVPTLISTPARVGRPALPSLSAQEESILECLARGEPNKRIAVHLSVTENMVKVHMKALLRKIGAPNRTAAAIWALNNLGSANP